MYLKCTCILPFFAMYPTLADIWLFKIFVYSIFEYLKKIRLQQSSKQFISHRRFLFHSGLYRLWITASESSCHGLRSISSELHGGISGNRNGLSHFQHDLLKRAEIEFRECLLENIELFIDVVRTSRTEFKNDHLLISEREMLRIKEFLQDDIRCSPQAFLIGPFCGIMNEVTVFWGIDSCLDCSSCAIPWFDASSPSCLDRLSTIAQLSRHVLNWL